MIRTCYAGGACNVFWDIKHDILYTIVILIRKSDSDRSCTRHEFVTGPLLRTQLSFYILEINVKIHKGFPLLSPIFLMFSLADFQQKSEKTEPVLHASYRPTGTKYEVQLLQFQSFDSPHSKRSPHQDWVQISLEIALTFQFPSFQESETKFSCCIHGGFVDVVQLKLKEAKSGYFIYLIIQLKKFIAYLDFTARESTWPRFRAPSLNLRSTSAFVVLCH